MFRRYLRLIAVFPVLVLVARVQGDWNGPNYPVPGPADPAKFYQLPDESLNGLDVKATFPKILADDWKCTSQDYVTDIHIWGSWLNNNVYPGVRFKLSIHADVPDPDGPGPGYSHPGLLLWSQIFGPGQYDSRLYKTVPGERFYDPNSNTILGTDTQIWQYNFKKIIDPFRQLGTPSLPVIYWLDVQAEAPNPFLFGWKSTDPAVLPVPTGDYMDDAVYGDTLVFGGEPYPQFPDANGLPWKDMHYPDGPHVGQSINLAFVITTNTAPDFAHGIPTVSEWGLIILTLLLLTAATIIFARRRAAVGRTA